MDKIQIITNLAENSKIQISIVLKLSINLTTEKFNLTVKFL